MNGRSPIALIVDFVALLLVGMAPLAGQPNTPSQNVAAVVVEDSHFGGGARSLLAPQAGIWATTETKNLVTSYAGMALPDYAGRDDAGRYVSSDLLITNRISSSGNDLVDSLNVVPCPVHSLIFQRLPKDCVGLQGR
jgi:hypothetical protein